MMSGFKFSVLKIFLKHYTFSIAGTGVNPDGLYPEVLQLLLETRLIDLDTVDTVYGRTAAHWAVVYKRHDLLLQLMSAGELVK